jgi:hypothetical protein
VALRKNHRQLEQALIGIPAQSRVGGVSRIGRCRPVDVDVEIDDQQRQGK